MYHHREMDRSPKGAQKKKEALSKLPLETRVAPFLIET